MNVAFPTMDGVSISAHFGRSKGFLVLETEGAAVLHREVRENAQAAHGAHHGHDHAEPGALHGHGHTGGSHGHDHGAFARLLHDCQVVIVRGMGAGAVRALQQAGIRVCRVEEGCTPEEALARLAANQLADLQGGTCGCGGHAH
ncbi:MAG: dinitrogenase iron-molybdenum cofactor biosynthesis protein [Firmicutes bacterium]|nr:dinitrogenase iron-molybdenum cofactor biosynthesis protein [Bacillota bacterium]